MDRENWIDIAKAFAFVLAGTLGVLALVAFFEGVRDGYSGAERSGGETPAGEHAGASENPGPGADGDGGG